MSCGLYGKLPAKRDFVAVSAPRAFLGVFEPWLQGGLSASRLDLGETWQQVFLRAPIWRFWLGADVCQGMSVAGAFMPSVDGVGRYFPLTVFAIREKPDAIPPPELDPQEAWFAKAEEFLLSALETGNTFEMVSEKLSGLGHPSTPQPGGRTEGCVRLRDGTLLAAVSPATLPDRLAALRVADQARVYATTTVWWTIGGEDYPPLTLVGQRMPSPFLFTALLTGRFEGAE
jgi:type VI secretion system protein ImpM